MPAAVEQATAALEASTISAAPTGPNVEPSAFKLKELAGELKEEPMCKENPNRFVIFPIQNDEVWQMYKKAEASFWTAEELDLNHDQKDWDK